MGRTTLKAILELSQSLNAYMDQNNRSVDNLNKALRLAMKRIEALEKRN